MDSILLGGIISRPKQNLTALRDLDVIVLG